MARHIADWTPRPAKATAKLPDAVYPNPNPEAERKKRAPADRDRCEYDLVEAAANPAVPRNPTAAQDDVRKQSGDVRGERARHNRGHEEPPPEGRAHGCSGALFHC